MRATLTPRGRIVVADDDLEMRRLLGQELAAHGYEVLSVGSGTGLLNELRRAQDAGTTPDLIVSDVRMPGQSGLDVLRALRGWGWTIPVILITAFGDDDVETEAAESGATCIFSKPFEVDDLRLAVEHLVPS